MRKNGLFELASKSVMSDECGAAYDVERKERPEKTE
jgi:hypothetical protein